MFFAYEKLKDWMFFWLAHLWKIDHTVQANNGAPFVACQEILHNNPLQQCLLCFTVECFM